MNRCAFVVPLHPKHFSYGYNIADSLSKSDADLYFVFTNEAEKDLFQRGENREEHQKGRIKYDFFLLENFMHLSIAEQRNSFVIMKKLYATSALYTKYDYISCIDAEVQFLKSQGFYEMMKSVVDSRIIFGGRLLPSMNLERKIVKTSLTSVTSPRYHKRLDLLSKDFSVFTWWSNIPVYDCKNVKDFLKWIHFPPEHLSIFSWYLFDDMTYNFFCILLHDYSLQLVPTCIHSLELQSSVMIQKTNDSFGKILKWVNSKAYHQNPFYYTENNFYVVFHMDRFKEHAR